MRSLTILLNQRLLLQVLSRVSGRFTIPLMGGTATPPLTLQFTDTGALIPGIPAAGSGMKGSAINLHGTFNPAGAADYDIDIDYTGTTQLSQGFTTTRNKSDGYTSGVKKC